MKKSDKIRIYLVIAWIVSCFILVFINPTYAGLTLLGGLALLFIAGLFEDDDGSDHITL